MFTVTVGVVRVVVTRPIVSLTLRITHVLCHSHQVVEIRELRDFAELEKQRELEELRSQLLEEKANEIQALQARLEANKVPFLFPSPRAIVQPLRLSPPPPPPPPPFVFARTSLANPNPPTNDGFIVEGRLFSTRPSLARLFLCTAATTITYCGMCLH